ncbi:hypothetical protein GCM10010275_63090 [Streptomyces litmocidini]|nr:hypothetical protein GCM10010275_63090 [Streptomyces litmocidini]
MEHAVRAAWHAWRTKHQLWSDEMIRSGGSGTVRFRDDCGEQFRPKGEGVPDWRTRTVRGERLEARPS